MPISSEPIIVATEVEDGDWSVLVMCSQLVPGDGVNFTQTTGMNNEGRIFFGLKESRNPVTSKGEDAKWAEITVVSVASLEY